jgi:hypothetical protein
VVLLGLIARSNDGAKEKTIYLYSNLCIPLAQMISTEREYNPFLDSRTQ